MKTHIPYTKLTHGIKKDILDGYSKQVCYLAKITGGLATVYIFNNGNTNYTYFWCIKMMNL